MFKERVNKVQELIKSRNYDGYLVFLCDDHGSEYVTSHYRTIAYISGFTGSAATLLITKDDAYLWTDGRYFLQAANQLKESGVKLMKMGIDEDLTSFIANNINTLAFDFKVCSVSFANNLLSKKSTLNLVDDESIIDEVWEKRPSIPGDKVWALEDDACSETIAKKLEKTMKAAGKKENYAVLVSDLADIAYLLNTRGKDVPCNPVFAAFLFLTRSQRKTAYTLYIKGSKVPEEIKERFEKNGVAIKPYNAVYDDVAAFNGTIFYDALRTNYKLSASIKNGVEGMLYPTHAKAIKGKFEIRQTKDAHLRDAVAMCKFLYWVKTYAGHIRMSEISAADHLEDLRRRMGAYDLSFETIAGYKEHGAIIHYSATKETNVPVKNDGFFLVDSGGQYLYGTTDITRTIALKNITKEMKYHFTLVLKSHIALSAAVFEEGTTDVDLDYICRKPIWDAGLDFNHGTGHGVGHCLNVHEGPQRIMYKNPKPVAMEEGMVTSDEPGLYFEGKYGIRHENEILCVRVDDTHLGFEPLTYVPFDLDAVDVSMLTEDEKKWLNDYHEMVFKKVSRFLDPTEKKFLKNATRKI